MAEKKLAYQLLSEEQRSLITDALDLYVERIWDLPGYDPTSPEVAKEDELVRSTADLLGLTELYALPSEHPGFDIPGTGISYEKGERPVVSPRSLAMALAISERNWLPCTCIRCWGALDKDDRWPLVNRRAWAGAPHSTAIAGLNFVDEASSDPVAGRTVHSPRG